MPMVLCNLALSRGGGGTSFLQENFPGRDGSAAGRKAHLDAAKPPVDLSLVMVIASTMVDRIVVSHIIEGVGLKVAACEAQEAQGLFRQKSPCVVVAEEATNEAGRARLQFVAEARAGSATGMPLFVVLSRTGSALADVPADAVVTMPITPERLAPVVRRLVERARMLVSS